jgi:uncharacterized protein (DUF1697 family)
VGTVVAFLRAINVGGRFIKMASLASHFATLGLQDVSTYINSGNVLFKTRATNLARLSSTVESGLEPLLGFKSEVFLRIAGEVHAVAQQALDHRAVVPAEGEVNVAFLSAPLSPEQLAALQSLRTAIDDFKHTDREVYWLCHTNQMQSKFSNAAMERKLRVRCTFRRVSMLEKLSNQLRSAGEA